MTPLQREQAHDIRTLTAKEISEKYGIPYADALIWKEPKWDGRQESYMRYRYRWQRWRVKLAEEENAGRPPHGYFIGDGIPRDFSGNPYDPFKEKNLEPSTF
ncbi:hypothetical protein [Bifidobacterium magnum]|uniref:Uncharacterized protein n=1 Tax=Bifidobacterium magnum TaxID=1692 RepID=A0A087BB60_9BIFI|nr:hypothetical protein [Bifidobacterium magnum]KFI68260.1 hypothetical protein BMAGN_0211 [Bifidobacterium magnum]